VANRFTYSILSVTAENEGRKREGSQGRKAVYSTLTHHKSNPRYKGVKKREKGKNGPGKEAGHVERQDPAHLRLCKLLSFALRRKITGEKKKEPEETYDGKKVETSRRDSGQSAEKR